MFEILIKNKDDDLNNDPQFSHHQGMDIAIERQHWDDMFDSQDLKKILKSVKSKSTVSSKMPILLNNRTSIFTKITQISNNFFVVNFMSNQSASKFT